MEIKDIASICECSPQNIYQTLKSGCGKLYKKVKRYSPDLPPTQILITAAQIFGTENYEEFYKCLPKNIKEEIKISEMDISVDNFSLKSFPYGL